MKTSNDILPGPLSEHKLRKQWNQQADEHNQWESLESEEQLAWAQVRAIAMDREAAPPALPSDVEHALIAASDALTDIAEGRASKVLLPLEWAEGRAFRALEQIRPVVRRLGVSTSEPPAAPPVVKESLTTAAAMAPGPSLDELDKLCEKHEFHYEDDYSLQCLLNIVRDAILSWSGLVAPSADGEVAELVEWLNSTAELEGSASIEEAKRYWRASELLQQRHPAPVPPGLTSTRFDTGEGVTIERTTLPPRPERWAVRCGGDCLTTDSNWVYEEQPSNRCAGWLAFHRFSSLQAAWEALQRAGHLR